MRKKETIKKIYIPYLNGRPLHNGNYELRVYKSVENFLKKFPIRNGGFDKLVEYAINNEIEASDVYNFVEEE